MNKQKGQTLLFVVLALTIALALAINVSVRTLSSLSRVAKVDTASRALATAEGGLEQFLQVSAVSMSDSFKDTSCPVGETCTSVTCPGYTSPNLLCRISYDAEKISSFAVVEVSKFEPQTYTFALANGETREINLDGMGTTDLNVCWSSPDYKSDMYYLLYGDSGVIEKQLYSLPDANYVNGYDSTATSADSSGCFQIDSADLSSAKGLRLRVLGADADEVTVSTANQNVNLPLQGYLLTSTGQISSNNEIQSTKTIRVLYTLPFVISGIDHGLFVGSGGVYK